MHFEFLEADDEVSLLDSYEEALKKCQKLLHYFELFGAGIIGA